MCIRINVAGFFLLLLFGYGIDARPPVPYPELVIADDPLSRGGDEICSVAFSPDSSVIAVKLYHSDLIANQGIVLWSLVDGSLINIIEGPGDGVHMLRFASDGRSIASTDGQIWDIQGERRFRLTNSTETVYDIAFSPDGQLGASSGARTARNIILWDAHTGVQVHTLKSDSPSGKALGFTRDGRTLLSAGRDVLQFWSVDAGRLMRTISPDCGKFSLLAYSETRNILAVTECGAAQDNAIKLYDAGTGQFISELTGHTSAIWSIDFRPDGQLLASSSNDSTIKLWDTTRGILIRTLKGHSKIIRTVAFSPDGETLASGGGDNDTKLWSASTGELNATLRVFKDGNWIAYTPDGYYLSSQGASKYVKWRVGKKLYRESVFRTQFFRPDVIAARLQKK